MASSIDLKPGKASHGLQQKALERIAEEPLSDSARKRVELVISESEFAGIYALGILAGWDSYRANLPHNRRLLRDADEIGIVLDAVPQNDEGIVLPLYHSTGINAISASNIAECLKETYKLLQQIKKLLPIVVIARAQSPKHTVKVFDYISNIALQALIRDNDSTKWVDECLIGLKEGRMEERQAMLTIEEIAKLDIKAPGNYYGDPSESARSSIEKAHRRYLIELKQDLNTEWKSERLKLASYVRRGVPLNKKALLEEIISSEQVQTLVKTVEECSHYLARVAGFPLQNPGEVLENLEYFPMLSFRHIQLDAKNVLDDIHVEGYVDKPSQKLRGKSEARYTVKRESLPWQDVGFGNDGGACIGIYDDAGGHGVDSVPAYLLDRATMVFGIYQETGRRKPQRTGFVLSFLTQNDDFEPVLLHNSIELSPQSNPLDEPALNALTDHVLTYLSRYAMHMNIKKTAMGVHEHNTGATYRGTTRLRSAGNNTLLKLPFHVPEGADRRLDFFSEVIDRNGVAKNWKYIMIRS
jgi:hypothetical protein